MTKKHFTTIYGERKRGHHLGSEERGVIQALKKLGYSNRAIARELGCSPSTVGYELKRGTPQYSGRGRIQRNVVLLPIDKTGVAADTLKWYRETQRSSNGWWRWYGSTSGPSISVWAEQDG